MATWPGGLPDFENFLTDSYRETAPDNVIRTQMDYGPDKVRQRGTAAPTIFTGDMILTEAEVATFRTFFDSTINYGADAFDAVHPRTAAAISARFLVPPDYGMVGIKWRVTMQIEILP
jgi:hypothetical protein